MTTNTRNKNRDDFLFDIGGEKLTARMLSEDPRNVHGLPPRTIYDRIYRKEHITAGDAHAPVDVLLRRLHTPVPSTPKAWPGWAPTEAEADAAQHRAIATPILGVGWDLDPDIVRREEAPEVVPEVDHPKHYTQGGVECIDGIEAALTPEEFRGYCKGNIIKYTWREKHKHGATDMRKASWYFERLIRHLENIA